MTVMIAASAALLVGAVLGFACAFALVAMRAGALGVDADSEGLTHG